MTQTLDGTFKPQIVVLKAEAPEITYPEVAPETEPVTEPTAEPATARMTPSLEPQLSLELFIFYPFILGTNLEN